MSDKTEAAQKWAEASVALGAAEQAASEASTTLQTAQRAEREAWAALEALAGRTAAVPPLADYPGVGAAFAFNQAMQSQARGQMLQQDPMRHSLPVKPIG